jgi:hypothetical protein
MALNALLRVICFGPCAGHEYDRNPREQKQKWNDRGLFKGHRYASPGSIGAFPDAKTRGVRKSPPHLLNHMGFHVMGSRRILKIRLGSPSSAQEKFGENRFQESNVTSRCLADTPLISGTSLTLLTHVQLGRNFLSSSRLSS